MPLPPQKVNWTIDGFPLDKAPGILFHTPEEAPVLTMAAQDSAVLDAGVSVERLVSDVGCSNELEKIFDWQTLVSKWAFKRDLKEFGLNPSLDRRDKNKVRDAALRNGRDRAQRMLEQGRTAVFTCVSDIGGTGLSLLYDRFDALAKEILPQPVDNMAIFRQGSKFVVAQVVDTPPL